MASIRLKLNNLPTQYKCYKEFDEFFGSVVSRINSFRLKESERDEIYQMFANLIEENKKLTEQISQQNNSNLDSLKSSSKYIIQEIAKHSTKYKRNKEYEKSEDYVPPEKKAVGLKWQSNYDHKTGVAHHLLKQQSFNYVSIIKLLENLFSNQRFKLLYDSNDHKCSPGVYQRYCCAQGYAQTDFYKENPNAIQLQLYTDEFEITSPLKSKTKIHKLCAVYLQILNLPKQYLSRLDNIYLVALCESANLDQEYTNIDNLLELIVNDIKKLEINGVKCGHKTFLKGTLINFSYDNLGGNDVCGFKKSFSSDYFCRHCECTYEESKKWVKEEISSLRTIENYNAQLESISSVDKVDYSISKGIRKPCVLNNLNNFHILRNKSCDLMHDMNEGSICFVLKRLFLHCIDQRIFTKKEIQDIVRDFNYGQLSKKNKPSFLDLGSRNLGQSACQLYCLMIHTPFMLYKYQHKLEPVRICIESLLQIMQILYSTSITEDDVVILENLIEVHLSSIIEKLDMQLFPKQHFLTHYPSIIRSNGPVLNNWSMRMEAKHSYFTKIAHSTNNYVNIADSLAKAHQKHMFNTEYSYSDRYEASKRRKTFLQLDISNLVDTTDMIIDEMFSLDFFSFNDIEYRIGLVLADQNKFQEITYILSNGTDYWFVCNSLRVKSFNQFLNSFEVEKSESTNVVYTLINHSDLSNKNSYEKKYLNCMTFIQANTLDLTREHFYK